MRLGFESRIAQRIDLADSLPAGGQGAVGIELRSEDSEVGGLLQSLHHKSTAQRVTAERAMNRRLEGGCQVPIAGFAEHYGDGDELLLRGLVGRPDGSEILRAQARAPSGQAEQLGVSVAEDLLAQGAADILAEIYAV